MRNRISIAVMMAAAVLLGFSVIRHRGASTELASTAMGQGLRTQAASVDSALRKLRHPSRSKVLRIFLERTQ